MQQRVFQNIEKTVLGNGPALFGIELRQQLLFDTFYKDFRLAAQYIIGFIIELRIDPLQKQVTGNARAMKKASSNQRSRRFA